MFFFISRQTISYIIDLQKKHGTDYWWTLSLEELFPKDVLHKFNLSIDNIEKGQVSVSINMNFNFSSSYMNLYFNNAVNSLFETNIALYNFVFNQTVSKFREV